LVVSCQEIFRVRSEISYSSLHFFYPKGSPTTYLGRLQDGVFDTKVHRMSPNTPSTLANISENLIPSLGSRWKSAEQIAQTYGRSRPWVYAIADRFKLRSVSLAETGKVGARLFDAFQMESLLEQLAETQKGQPRVNPRGKTKEKT